MRLPVYLAVTAGTLRAAFDDVAGYRARGEFVELVRPPAEAVDHRGERERGIGGASGDHHVRSGCEGFGEREGADVGIGALDAVADRG